MLPDPIVVVVWIDGYQSVKRIKKIDSYQGYIIEKKAIQTFVFTKCKGNSKNSKIVS